MASSPLGSRIEWLQGESSMTRPLSILPVLILVTASTAKPTEINELPDSSDRNIPLSFPDLDDNRVNTTKVLRGSDSLEHWYSSVIESLEKINVLPQSCIKFEKITRDVINVDKSTGVRTIGVYLYFQESSNWRNNLDDSGKKLQGLSPLHGSNSKSDTSAGNSDLKHKIRCRSESKVVMMDAYSLMRQKGSENTSQDSSGSDYNNTSTSVMVGAHSNSDDIENSGSPGISRTQLVVISTCSAIIGTFFLIAGIMRLRNYIKRYRQNQRQASRPTFRSCSVALRNSTPSNEQIHRDSLLSKSSSFHSNYTGRGTGPPYPASQSSRDNSRNSSPKTYADKTPLLVVTTPSDTTNTSTPTVSQVSLQYTDEDPMKSKTAKKTSSGSQDDIENRPLLNGDENHTVDIGRISDLGYVKQILNNKGPINEISTKTDKSDVVPCHADQETKAHPVTQGEVTHDVLVNKNPSQANGQNVPNGETQLSPSVNDSTMLLSLDLAANENVGIGASNFGLTQSDSSLSSITQPYSYGNQMEYYGDLDMYMVPVGLFTYENLNLANQSSRGLVPMPSLVSFSENSFDYGSGASSMQSSLFPNRGDKSLGKRAMSLNEPQIKEDSLRVKRSMSLAEDDSNLKGKRVLQKANSVTGADNSDSYTLRSVNSIHEHDESKEQTPEPSDKRVQSSAQQHLSAQEKRELFGCGQETSVRSSGDLSREPSSEARPTTPTNSISKLLSCEEERTTLL